MSILGVFLPIAAVTGGTRVILLVLVALAVILLFAGSTIAIVTFRAQRKAMAAYASSIEAENRTAQ